MSGQATLLQMVRISKHFPGVQALQSVDFDLYAGEVHALVGENGAGKSTLIKIMGGALFPDQGRILLNGRETRINNPREAIGLGIALIHQELMLVPQLSVAENILLGHLPQRALGRVDWSAARAQATEGLSVLGLQIDTDALVEDLSVAQQQAVEIARALSRQAQVFVMDEPTSALAAREVDNLLKTIERLKLQGKGIVFVTHKLDEVFRVADRITVLRDGCKISTLERTEANPQQIVNLMVGRSIESLFLKKEVKVGRPVLEVRGLTRRGIFEDVSLTLHRGEILGLAGLVGSRRSDLARTIFGADPADSGEILIQGHAIGRPSPARMMNAGVALVPEDRKRQGLVLEMSVADNLTLALLRRLGQLGLRDRGEERVRAAALAHNLAIATPSLRTNVISLSGGNQQKVVMGKWLATNPRILILDEPTRGIDVGAKAEIYAIMQRLAQQGVAMLLSSSELVEVLGVSDRILVMHEGRITGEFAREEATEEAIMACATGQATRLSSDSR
jgi:ABC-type sugar transport system ATPase subunit